MSWVEHPGTIALSSVTIRTIFSLICGIRLRLTCAVRDEGKTRVKLPSGAKKVIKSTARGMVGIVAGGGRTDKPLLSMENSGRCPNEISKVTRCIFMDG